MYQNIEKWAHFIGAQIKMKNHLMNLLTLVWYRNCSHRYYACLSYYIVFSFILYIYYRYGYKLDKRRLEEYIFNNKQIKRQSYSLSCKHVFKFSLMIIISNPQRDFFCGRPAKQNWTRNQWHAEGGFEVYWRGGGYRFKEINFRDTL